MYCIKAGVCSGRGYSRVLGFGVSVCAMPCLAMLAKVCSRKSIHTTHNPPKALPALPAIYNVAFYLRNILSAKNFKAHFDGILPQFGLNSAQLSRKCGLTSP